jgi:hypothetical protein
MGGGKFLGVAKGDSNFRLLGRWTNATEGGVISDTAGASVSFQVTGAEQASFVAHRSCGQRVVPDSSSGGSVYCSAWALEFGSALHVDPIDSKTLYDDLYADVLVNGIFAGSITASPRCGADPSSEMPESHVLHRVSGLDAAAVSRITLITRSDAKRGGLTVRSLALPRTARLLRDSTPKPRGRMVSIGGSKTLGQGTLCDVDAQSSAVRLPHDLNRQITT